MTQSIFPEPRDDRETIMTNPHLSPEIEPESLGDAFHLEDFINSCLSAPSMDDSSLFPTRTLLNDNEEDQAILQDVINRKLSALLVVKDALPRVEVINDLQASLCGTRPLTAPELTWLFRAIANAVRHRLQTDAHRAADRLKSITELSVHPSQTDAGRLMVQQRPRDDSLADQTTVDSNQGWTLLERELDIESALSFNSAITFPQRTLEVIDAIESLIQSDEQHMDIYRLFFFGTCTEPEIAGILNHPFEDVEKRIAVAKFELHKLVLRRSSQQVAL